MSSRRLSWKHDLPKHVALHVIAYLDVANTLRFVNSFYLSPQAFNRTFRVPIGMILSRKVQFLWSKDNRDNALFLSREEDTNLYQESVQQRYGEFGGHICSSYPKLTLSGSFLLHYIFDELPIVPNDVDMYFRWRDNGEFELERETLYNVMVQLEGGQKVSSNRRASPMSFAQHYHLATGLKRIFTYVCADVTAQFIAVDDIDVFVNTYDITILGNTFDGERLRLSSDCVRYILSNDPKHTVDVTKLYVEAFSGETWEEPNCNTAAVHLWLLDRIHSRMMKYVDRGLTLVFTNDYMPQLNQLYRKTMIRRASTRLYQTDLDICINRVKLLPFDATISPSKSQDPFLITLLAQWKAHFPTLTWTKPDSQAKQ